MELKGKRIYVLYVTYFLIHFASCNQDEKRLHRDLLEKRKYNKLIRPSAEGQGALVVKLGMRLSQLLRVVSSANLFT